MRCPRLVLSASQLALFSAGLAAQHTWIVAPSGGQFTDLQTAIDIATPGDTILVRGGSYSGAVLDRSLRVLGVQARPFINGLGVWPGTTVVLAGFDTYTMALTHCTASLENVNALDLELDGATVTCTRCTFDCRSTATLSTHLIN